jgi:plastocyanin
VHPTRAAMIALVLPLAAAGVAGCGSSKSSTAPVGTATANTGAPTAPGQVAIVDYDFNPNTITVKAGGTVTWTNQDTSDHWVVSAPTSPASFDLGRQHTSATVSHTFTAPGSYPYFCNLHNYMKGTVVVQ